MSRQHARWSFLDKSLEQSFLWSLAITALPVAAGFAVSWLIARWEGPRVMGVVSWVMALATAGLILGKFGLDLAVSRLASEYGVKFAGSLRPLLKRGIGLRLVFTLAVSLATLVLSRQIAAFFDDAELVNPIRIGALVILCASLYEFKENFLIGLNRLNTVYKVRSLAQLTRIGLTCAVVFLGFGATAILAGYCAAWLLAIGAYAVLLFRFLPEEDHTKRQAGMVRRLVLLSAPLAVSSASVTVYSQMDKLMLGYFSGVEEVGQYTVARNITEVSLFPIFALAMMLRPALASRFSSEELAQCGLIIRKSILFSLVPAVLCAAVLIVFGVPLTIWVFSESFRYSGELLVFFIWVIVMRSIGSVILPALVAADRTRFYAYLTTLSAVVNFFLNLILIPRFQSRGAILATIISYSILLTLGLAQVFRTYRVRMDKNDLSIAFRTILAGAVSSGLVWSIMGKIPRELDFLVWVALLAAAYILLIFLFRVSSYSNLKSLLTNHGNSNG
jgi:O-antigen/teichoic acid export membrane protein